MGRQRRGARGKWIPRDGMNAGMAYVDVEANYGVLFAGALEAGYFGLELVDRLGALAGGGLAVVALSSRRLLHLKSWLVTILGLLGRLLRWLILDAWLWGMCAICCLAFCCRRSFGIECWGRFW